MPTGTIQQVASVGGLSIQSSIQRTSTGGIGHDPVLPAANAGNLTTRTNDTDGELTLGADHGITDGQEINIFWTDVDGVKHCAYGATVGTVAGVAVPFTGAAGDVLPADEYAVTASVVVEIDTDFDGDLLEMISAGSTLLTHIAFRTVAPAVIKAVLLLPNEGWSWVSKQGIINPLAGELVDHVYASNGDASAATTLKIGVNYNST